MFPFDFDSLAQSFPHIGHLFDFRLKEGMAQYLL